MSRRKQKRKQYIAYVSALIYGATGYTGQLIARRAADYGIRPIVAGRNADAVIALARELGLDHRVFGLDDPAAIRRGLDGVTVVLHCAGPFIHTSRPMADACAERGVHYIDITGEIEVIEALARRDADARAAGVMLLPGAGYDVVPSDCLAAHLKARLPSATWLMLGIAGTGRLSRGTASTMVEHAKRGGMVRRGGKLTRVPQGWRTRRIDFGRGGRTAVTIPWGDVATAWYSTGIPNIEVYAAAPRSVRALMRAARYFGWLLGQPWLKRWQLERIRSQPPGPSAEELQRGRSFVWGRVEDDEGRGAESRIAGPNGYQLTAYSALLILQRVLANGAKPGFQTPSKAFGADFVLQIPGVTREDV
jgi:short subunit dehydrogenase-like uncharacterized protein